MSILRRLTSRRLAVGAVVLVLAGLWAAGTVSLLGVGGGDIAVGGPLPMHAGQPTPGGDDLPGDGSNEPLTLTVPAGPHLTVPILYYHYIRLIPPTPQNGLSFRLSIAPALFAEQMALLDVEGAHPITLATLVSALEGHTALPPHPVVLTFDDGYADFATAVEPVMAHYAFVATDFVVSGFINRPRYMTAAQVLQMNADGMVIGSHTMHHVDLARMTVAQARAEIDGGKSALEALLGHPVLDFAYPYGAFNAAVVQLVEQAGFRDAASTVPGDVQSLGGRFLLHRTEIGGAPSLATFATDAGLTAPTPAQDATIASLASHSTGPISG